MVYNNGSNDISHPLEPHRKANIVIRFSEFEIPPMQDIMLVGKKAPIGPEAAKRMVDGVAPEQYEIIELDGHEIFEAIVVRKSLLKILPKETLTSIIVEEGERIGEENIVLRAQINVTIQINRVVDL